jgi:NAD+ kinase
VQLARLSTSPFTDRLVAKFDLSILGWRGEARLEEAARAADLQTQAEAPRPPA